MVDNQTSQSSTDTVKIFDVIDGQQRLTTIQLIFSSLIQATKNSACNRNVREDLEQYIFSDDEKQDTKLKPTNFDQAQFQQVMFHAYDKLPTYEAPSAIRGNLLKSKVMKTFEFFTEKISDFISEGDEEQKVDALKETLLEGFELVLIALKESDEAQKVFESMNNTAKPLTTFDLIRNDVFYRASKEGPERDKELFDSEIWQQLEKPFWEELSGKRAVDKANTHLEAYVARMLMVQLAKMKDKKDKEIEFRFNRTDIFKNYKSFSRKHENVEKEIAIATEYVNIYRYLVFETDTNPVNNNFRFGIFRSQDRENKDFYPVLFMICSSDTDDDKKQRVIDVLESFVIRRDMCGLSFKGYNKIVARLCRELNDSMNNETLEKVLSESDKDTNRFPDDDEIRKSCRAVNFYKSPLKFYILEEINKCLYDKADEIIIKNL